MQTAMSERRRRPEAAWKLFILIPRMLLRPTVQQGEEGKKEFFERMRRFNRGDWIELLHEAADSGKSKRQRRDLDKEEVDNQQLARAEAKIKLREITRARVIMTSAGVAPGTDETLRKLRARPTEQVSEIPANALHHAPAQPITLERAKLQAALRGGGR
eukprot:3956716-Karenia_brevis.AAC.1